MRVRSLFPLLVALSLPACGGAARQYAGGNLNYTVNARRAYNEAMVDFKDHDWIEAGGKFREVRRRFAFSEYAPLAQLRLCDIEFEQEKWIEAIRLYREFIRENPQHPDLPWAQMRIARGYFNQISDAPLMPPSEQRDQSAVLEAAREIRVYLEQFPEGPDHAAMEDLGADVLARLVAHELYVARFYLRRDQLEAALERASYAIRTFHGSKRDVEALVLQGEILLRLKRRREARSAFVRAVRDYPRDPRIEQARRYLAELPVD